MIVLAIVAVAVVAGFSLHLGYADEDKDQVVKLIVQFHERINSERFNDIYDDAHPAFHKALSREEWLRHMRESWEQYGKFETIKSSRVGVVMGAPVQTRAVYYSNF